MSIEAPTQHVPVATPESLTGGENFTPLRLLTNETASINPEARQRNHEVVRKGFLTQDREGRCTPGGVCNEAYKELTAKCGDPKTWTEQDMNRPEIQELLLTSRTFVMLLDNRSLIPEEQATLLELLDRQQEINIAKDTKIHVDVTINTRQEQSQQAQIVADNQARLNEIRAALNEGINSEIVHTVGSLTNSADTTTLRWSQPTEMSVSLVRMTVEDPYITYSDKERSNRLRSVDQPISRPRTPDEEAFILRQLTEQIRKLKELEIQKKQAEESQKDQDKKAKQEPEVINTETKDEVEHASSKSSTQNQDSISITALQKNQMEIQKRENEVKSRLRQLAGIA